MIWAWNNNKFCGFVKSFKYDEPPFDFLPILARYVNYLIFYLDKSP